jgi:DNA-binding transcriptional ArsR family regulator
MGTLMPGTDAHDHPIDGDGVMRARAGVIPSADAGRLEELLGLIADPVRSRLLFALSTVDRLCVGDLALALEVSDDAASYGLRMLRTAGLVHARKEGRVVYYSLAPSFPHPLLEHCLRQLLTVAVPEERP